MTVEPAGTKVDYTITWLEMDGRPDYGWPTVPVSQPASLLHAVAPPPWYFLSLYDAVGRHYAWEDMHRESEAEIAAYLADPDVALFTLLVEGWPHGFFILDARAPDVTDIDLFGLVPEAVGKGLGRYLLRTAILTAWEREGLKKLTVNTCSLDHPRALALYQSNGFTPVKREDRSRILTRPRDTSRIPE